MSSGTCFRLSNHIIYLKTSSRFPSTVNTTGTVLISGHYDSRPSFGSTRAPGGNDDGSGTVALLGVARAIARAGVKFKSNVEIVAYAGEEQGLLGSRAYARTSHSNFARSSLLISLQVIRESKGRI